MTHKDANPEICHCMKVTYRDVEDAINSSERLTDVTEEFKEVQEKTQCTTGCGGCYNDILVAISEIMNG
ncbi:MAG: (2Fe-2S)-binding protein [Oscillospiraceae bacterium]|nr:(2Fe-2S)-binding protein [Oscillospiraceae bacterium]MDD6086308.1 (2Fe-2S)-binding protein [Oscillospiraceae bacterium]MDY3257578.1 (2Fe-2S)-binding protein [Ruminococcus callidus]